ncbi:MAG: SMP-30/gluconolactonase/LRE family protein [Gammaproteobacteria bacterium]
MNRNRQGCLVRLVHAAIALLISGTVAAQSGSSPNERFFTIEQHAPGLEELIAPSAAAELLGDRYGLTEGPVWVDANDGGYLLFTDLISNVIYKWAPNGGTSVFLENAGYSGNDKYVVGTQTIRARMNVLMIGPNGLTLDPQGRVVWCASPEGRVMRLEKDGSRTVIAEKYQGKKFSGPNDLVYRSDGVLYFTESIWGLRGVGGGHTSPYRELPFTGVFMVKNAQVSLLVDEKALGGMPNGLAFSPDEKQLYLNADDKKIMRYDVKTDGTLANGTVFFDGEGSDGIKVDERGNVYTTSGAGPGEVRITSPKGVRIGTLKLPTLNREPRAQICATNVAFGDRDGKGLYITACEHVYRVQMRVAGVRPH